MEPKLMKTKAGRGFKLITSDGWVYTSIEEMQKMLNDEARACVFRKKEGREPSVIT